MKNIIISTKTLILIPVLFVIILIGKVFLNYNSSQDRMYDFVQKQAQTLNEFMVVHRNYYQDLYLNKTIPLNEKTLLGLPAYSSFNISKQFSAQNYFDISVQTVSQRARNQKNNADKNELKAIDFFNKNREQKEYFNSEEDYFQYATPLFIQAKCLACHGAKESAPKFISQKYHTAYDYKVGELRGIISIKVPKEKIGDYFISTLVKDIVFDIFIVLIIFLTTSYLVKYFRSLSRNLEVQVKEKTNELQKNVAFLKSHQLAMDESSIVSKADLKGNITYVNDNFCKITRYTKDEVIGKPHSLLRHPSNPKSTFVNLWETIKEKKVWKGILQNQGKNSDYWVDIVILPILDNDNNIVEYIAIRHDITKMIHQQEVLDSAANTDTLTGLGNRYKLNNDTKNSINPALAILNIDGFSQINDFYGHEKGDVVIRNLGIQLEKLKNDKNYTLYHLQGDEYVLFNQNIDKQKFIDKITQITSLVSTAPILLDSEEIYLNLSTAISFEEKSKILQTADMALKVARKENKNVVVYNDDISLNDEYENNIKWAKKIKDGLEQDKFIPVFQPIVNNHNKKWEKYEALVRLEDDGKLISPYFFLEISKKTKHYTDITKVMLKKSFDMFKDRTEEFSVNLTIEDILNEDIKIYIFAMLEEYQIGNRVVFEIVESESIENFEQIAIFITKIKSYGSKIAIDDFGTGYSNFEYLMKVKADYIKIDGSMIKNIDKDSDAEMVVSTIVDFAKKMGMKTIAEFVETQSILDKVNELGIDYTQGYFYSEPKRDID
jgi:diguanylate cyclase (GGDEF)-like protein/PAS domain S-box-containing protein